MRARAPDADVAIEIEVEHRVELEATAMNVDYMNLVIALHVHDTAGREIFDQKVVRHDEALFVAREAHEMGARVGAEIDDAHQRWLVRSSDVEHGNHAGTVERHEEARALPVHAKEIGRAHV